MGNQVSSQGGAVVSGNNVNVANTGNGVIQFGANSTVVQNVYQPPAERACPTPPMPPDRFGGRNGAYEALISRLKAGSVIIHAIVGDGGVGKTILAQKIAFDFYHGTPKNCRAVLWSELSPQPDPARLLREWAYKADSNFKSPENESLPQLAARVRDLLEELVSKECAECEPPRVLVVLDAVWENGLETVNLLRQACPANSLILITTRSKEISVNAGAMRFALNKMTVEEGSDMLKLYLPWADGEKLRKLAAITGGIPLAMKLAATNIELQDDPETALETQLQKAELASLSDAPSAGVAPEIDTVGEALKLNYNTLTPEEQVAFRTMGALPQALPFDLNVLAAIWQADEAKTRAYCEKLQKLSLLDSDKEFGMPGWFRLQPLLHEYAHNLLQQTGELEETFKRLINFIVPLAKNYETLAPQNWRQLDPYLPQILAASNIMRKQITDRLAQLSEEEKAQLWQDQEIRSALYLVLDFTFSFSSYLQIRPNQYKEDWLNVGLETSRILGDKVKEVHFLNSLGMYYYTQSDKQKAEEFFISALEFANQIGDKKGQATSLNNLGLVYAGSNRFEEALNYYNQALEVYHKLENPLGVASTFVDLAVISETLENYEEALTGYREARKIYADLDAKYSEADVCYKMGELLWKMDQAKEALELMETSQKLFQEINSPHAENLVQVIADMKAQI